MEFTDERNIWVIVIGENGAGIVECGTCPGEVFVMGPWDCGGKKARQYLATWEESRIYLKSSVNISA